MEKIKIAIVGYGNLGRGVELALSHSSDMELVGIFTRRDGVKTASGCAKNISELKNFENKVDVLILCGGSAVDLPEQGVELLKHFNTVDSFDNHSQIPTYFDAMNKVGVQYNHLGLVSVGWDPGLFSMARLLFGAVLPDGNDYTFWGKGVSQGHSNAIREISGVVDARQYTVPVDEAIEKVRNGESPTLSARQKHTRDCFVVAEENSDKREIERQIVTMPGYFEGYDTTVHFISAEEMKRNHSKLPHGGQVIRSGKTSDDNKQLLEFSIKLDSNSEFTSSVLVAFARGVAAIAKTGKVGCITALDIPLALLSPLSPEEQRKRLL